MSGMRRMAAALAACALCSAASAADELDSLFDLDKPLDAAGATGGDASSAAGDGVRWSGYGEFRSAYTYADPGHWSKLRARAELTANGKLGERTKFKLQGRLDVDPVFDLERQYYPAAVRRDQRQEFSVREAYLDTAAGDWEFRFGRQHVVWGEMVGLFLADVVSARDLRDFFPTELETIRIPQWAARAEYFGGDAYFELLWIPVPSYDEIGRPGTDFYPFPLPAGTSVPERKPRRAIDNGNWGVRATRLVAGWDLSAFFYRSLDVSPTLYRTSFAPTFELRHDRIRQIGGTVSKDFGEFVLKGEAVHTRGRSFPTSDVAAEFGVTKSDTFDYVIGVDIPVQDVWRFYVQHFSRVTYDHEQAMGSDRTESGLMLLVNRKLGDEFEAEVLMGSSFNREDYSIRPKLSWSITRDWRGQAGIDLFAGAKNGLFGRFDDRDRVYMEVRRWF